MFKFLLGFRKFTIMCAFLLVMIVFRVLNYVDGAQFAENMQLAVVAYFGTNLGEHLITVGKQWLEGKFNEVSKSSEKSS